MAGFGKRDQVRRKVDLTSGDGFGERRPGDRAYASDVEADAEFAILGKLLKIGLKVRDKAGSSTETVIYLWCTCTAMIPPMVTALICVVAGVLGAAMVVTCLVVLAGSGRAAVAVFRGAHRARREHQEAVRRELEERPREQRAVQSPKNKNKRKVVRRERRGKGGGGARSQRGRGRP